MIPTRRGIIYSIVLTIFLSGCSVLYGKDAPQRDFTVFDLLLTEKDLPPGWLMYGEPGKSIDTDRPAESAQINFITDIYQRPHGATLYVYQYRTSVIAHRDFEDIAPLNIHNNAGVIREGGWQFQSQYADESNISCFATVYEKDTPQSKEYTHCDFVVRYQEFVFHFASWLMPGRMTLQQMQDVAKIIDQNIVKRLYPGG